ncbi:MAG: UDP-N-acetylglucosamine diphosphorylase/glucosamine-1-phosphate N-acetyltransferase [Desulfobacteraceae bacterium 4572_35.1]|nr:MAG: UDP-N-acetylglucosamine diphosphorylase/glucosamine-1-phosphate N-acetyltransferase [Desulfobacteraceae bacterium 4572_35.1]
MSIQELATVILAAGKGTRMKSDCPKVLHPLVGKPLAAYPVRLAQELGCSPTVMVVGHQVERVQQQFADEDIVFVHQEQQLGTGHAFQISHQVLKDFSGTVLLLCGDVPLLRCQTIDEMLQAHASAGAAVSVLTANMEDPRGYGRIVRSGAEIEHIVEEKDASAEEKKITEINTGIYALEVPLAFELLGQLSNDNAQGEYYLTDIIALARTQGYKVVASTLDDVSEAMGINDRVQLAQAAAIMRERINYAHMVAGVTLIDPATTYIDDSVKIGVDTVIYPGAHLRGNTTIGSNCVVETGVVIDSCSIGNDSYIKAGSALEEADLGEHSTIGPMAHLRPGTVLCGNNKIGNFVETKKAVIGERSQASHLTYIGDAELGRDVNLGCGTITCNYDGVNKHKTVIEDGVFVGSDTQFIAPVTIGRNSLIGAGSTITKDVPADALALSRSEQKVIAGWCKRKK